jgi:hypothetical protein
MGDPQKTEKSTLMKVLLFPLWLLAWPFIKLWKFLYEHFISYVLGTSVRDRRRVYKVKFVWYGDSVYLHPMVWGGIVMYCLAISGVFVQGWLLFIWFMMLFACFLTIMYNFDILRSSVLLVGVVAILGMAYFATMELHWNPMTAFYVHIQSLQASVTPGFYLVSTYVFTACIAAEVLWAWLFHRVEIDESYVYEHAFLKGTVREPIFARGLKRETKDLLELLILGAGDIQHRTRNGYKRFKNVPFASLWLGSAIDSLLDYRRKGEVELGSKRRGDDSEDVRVEDALPDTAEDWEDGATDDGAADDNGGIE